MTTCLLLFLNIFATVVLVVCRTNFYVSLSSGDECCRHIKGCIKGRLKGGWIVDAVAALLKSLHSKTLYFRTFCQFSVWPSKCIFCLHITCARVGPYFRELDHSGQAILLARTLSQMQLSDTRMNFHYLDITVPFASSLYRVLNWYQFKHIFSALIPTVATVTGH